MSKVIGLEFDEYKYHNWKLCQLSLDLPISSLSHSPLEIQVEVTSHCNIQCTMCTRPYIVTNPHHLHPGILSKLIPLFPSAVRVIPFGGGEPLLYPHFKEIVESAKHYRSQVTFNTNGLLLNVDISKSFVSLGVDMITFSIDSVKEDTYQSIRRGSNYKKVLDNLATLIKLKNEIGGSSPMIGIAFVPMVDNFREIPDLFYLAHQIGVQRISFETLLSPAQNWNNEYKEYYRQHNLSNISHIELTSLLHEYDFLAKKLGLHIFPSGFFTSYNDKQGFAVDKKTSLNRVLPDQARIIKAGIGDKHRTGVACTLPWTTVFVSADGLIQTCCLSSRVFGDLKVQEFSEIWNGKEFQQYRNQIIKNDFPDECQNCLANGRNRETIPSLTLTREQMLTKEQLLSSWKKRSLEIFDRIYRKIYSPFHS